MPAIGAYIRSMALTSDQESEWIAQLEGMGLPQARSEFERNRIPPHLVHLTATWISAKDKEAEARREASNSEQLALARRAAEAAEGSARAAEEQAKQAQKANRIAITALAGAIIATIISIVSCARKIT
jgi:hypothetical protein